MDELFVWLKNNSLYSDANFQHDLSKDNRVDRRSEYYKDES